MILITCFGAIANRTVRKLATQPAGVGNMPPCCQMVIGGEQMGPNMMGMMQGMGPDMMKQMGMSPEMMERMMLLMRTPIFLDAPCPIYAQSDKLGLSDEQKKKLVEIENEARQKARAVLTPEQQARLGTVPNKPVTMMETCPMMKMMGGMGPAMQPAK